MAKRFLTFAFALVAYATFLFAAVYGIGFLENVFFRKTIDSGQNTNPVTAVMMDISLLALFGLQHSLMARQTFKSLATRFIVKPAERSLFVLCTSVCLWMLFWQWRPLGMFLWSFASGPISVFFLVLYGFGWLIVILSTFLIDHFDFTGLRQAYLYLSGRPYRPVEFKQHFFYRIVRHPMMLGLLICFWATPKMSLGHLLFSTGMTLYILVGLIFEERDLLKSFGETYLRYRREVPLLIPLPRSEKD